MRQSDFVCHLVKIDPSKPFDKLIMTVENANPVAKAYEGQAGNNYQSLRMGGNMGGAGGDITHLQNMVNMLGNRGGIQMGGAGGQMFVINGNQVQHAGSGGYDDDGDMYADQDENDDCEIDSNEAAGGEMMGENYEHDNENLGYEMQNQGDDSDDCPPDLEKN